MMMNERLEVSAWHTRVRAWSRVTGVLALALAVGLAGVLALPRPAEAAPPAFRYTLADGTVLVGVPLADEQDAITVQTSVGKVRVRKADITSIELADARPVGGPSAAPPAPPPAPAPTTVVVESDPPGRRESSVVIASGTGIFALSWFGSALAGSIALMADKDDKDAMWGLVPVAGPVIWANRTDSQRGLGFGILVTIFQASGVLALTTGLVMRATESAPGAQRVRIAPLLDTGGGGIAVSVPF